MKKLWRKKLALLLASATHVKPYYCEVEYLQSTGTQYIDTGISGSSTLKIEMYGQKAGASLGVYFGAGTGNNRIQAIYVNNYNSARIGDKTVIQLGSDTEKFNIVCDALNKSVIYNGTSFEFNYTAALTNLNIFIFARNEGSSYADKATAKCWSFKIWDNGVLVRDLIPVLDRNMTPCMYDRVSGELLYNKGTGTFSYGRQIHPVEYLEGTGTQYIATGLNYFADYEVGIKLRNNVSNKALGNAGTNCMERLSASTHAWRFTSGGSGYDSNIDLLEYHIMKWKEDKIYADDVLLTEKEKNKGTTQMTLFGAGNFYPNIIYFCKLWNPDNGDLVRDYIPAKDENDVGFMFDRVSHTIFDNAGSGSFITGNVVD